MGDLPAGWSDTTLGRAARWLSGGTPRTSESAYWGGTIPWITSGSLTSFKLQTSKRRITELGLANGSRLVPEGTTLFVVRGMSLKSEFRIGVAQRQLAFGQDCKALVAADGVVPLFLAYAIKSRSAEILDMVDEAGHGTGRLDTERLKGLSILIPSDDEQRSIADLLGVLDDKIESDLRLIGATHDYAEARFSALADVAEVRTVGDLCDKRELLCSDGYRTRKDQLGEPGVKILRVADMADGHIFADGTDHVSSEYLASAGSKVSKVDDVIVSTKGTVGRTALIAAGDPMVVYSPQICYFRVLDASKLSAAVLHRWVRSSKFHTQAKAVQDQSDMAPYVSLRDLRRFQVPMVDPAAPEVTELQNLERLLYGRRREIQALALLRDALLPELMSGRLRVPEAREMAGV